VKALLEVCAQAGLPAAVIGKVGGDRVRADVDGRVAADVPLADLRRAWEGGLGPVVG
jgi:uncharacterized membrane protein